MCLTGACPSEIATSTATMPATIITSSSTSPSSCSSKHSSSVRYDREYREYGASKSSPLEPPSMGRQGLHPRHTANNTSETLFLLYPERQSCNPQPQHGHRGGLRPQPVVHLVPLTPLTATPSSQLGAARTLSSSFFGIMGLGTGNGRRAFRAIDLHVLGFLRPSAIIPALSRRSQAAWPISISFSRD